MFKEYTYIFSNIKNEIFYLGKSVQLVSRIAVVCHKLSYPYVVFLCHFMNGTAIYKVPLNGEDGPAGTVMAACHEDTFFWSPDHMTFHLLKILPGTVPICNFLNKSTIISVDGLISPSHNLHYPLLEAVETFPFQTVHLDVYFLETKLH
ncbi:hypothetical protein GQ457_11G006200 [Hibiscus cannabinus]